MTWTEKKCAVALARCADYESDRLVAVVDRLAASCGFDVSRGSSVLLKPNLVSATTSGHLGCTSPLFVGAVAKWFLDQGAKVKVGDSPAFGLGNTVMRATGMSESLAPLDVECVNFARVRKITLPCGDKVPVAVDALECDLLVNLPKVKAHKQVYVSLSVKNYFGVVCGWRKALHHAVHGDVGNRFESLLVELPALFPEAVSIVDGIVALQKSGPISGEPYPLGVAGLSVDPVALDTALMEVIGADPEASIIMQECVRRMMPGSDPENIVYPLANPTELAVDDFLLPETLSPVTFHPVKMAVSGCKRITSRLRSG